MGSGQLFLFGQDVLRAGLDANSTTSIITAQIGDVISGSVESDDCEWWQQAGFASIPSSPTTSAAQCLAIRQTDRPVVFASRDNRMSGIYGNLRPGETCLYAGGTTGTAQAKVLLKDNGSVTLGTTDDNTATGNAVLLRVSPDKGLEFISPWGDLSFGPNGLRIRHSSGFEIRGVGLSGLSAGPLSVANVVKIKGAVVVLDAPSVLAGPAATATTYEPVIASATPQDPGLVPVLGSAPGAPTLTLSSQVLKVTS